MSPRTAGYGKHQKEPDSSISTWNPLAGQYWQAISQRMAQPTKTIIRFDRAFRLCGTSGLCSRHENRFICGGKILRHTCVFVLLATGEPAALDRLSCGNRMAVGAALAGIGESYLVVARQLFCDKGSGITSRRLVEKDEVDHCDLPRGEVSSPIQPIQERDCRSFSTNTKYRVYSVMTALTQRQLESRMYLDLT